MPPLWLDRRLEIRASPLHGRGTFALSKIGGGEVVTVWEHRILSPADVPGAGPGDVWPRADGTFVWLPPNDPRLPDHFPNHSCDPNVWMADEITLVARREVRADEELTADYAVFELNPEFICNFQCRCGMAICRRTITGRDWQLPELQQRYSGHWHPVLARRIAGSNQLGSGEEHQR